MSKTTADLHLSLSQDLVNGAFGGTFRSLWRQNSQTTDIPSKSSYE